MKKPIDKAREVFAEHCPKENFDVVLLDHLTNHYVHSSPRWFIMAKLVHLTARQSYDETGVKNCIHVTAAASHDTVKDGAIEELRKMIPTHTEFVSFQRRGDERLRIFRTDNLQRKDH